MSLRLPRPRPSELPVRGAAFPGVGAIVGAGILALRGAGVVRGADAEATFAAATTRESPS